MLYEVITDGGGGNTVVFDAVFPEKSHIERKIAQRAGRTPAGGDDPGAGVAADQVAGAGEVEFLRHMVGDIEVGPFPLPVDGIPSGSGTDVKPIFRITSYNVCYTKLLRPLPLLVRVSG